MKTRQKGRSAAEKDQESFGDVSEEMEYGACAMEMLEAPDVPEQPEI